MKKDWVHLWVAISFITTPLVNANEASDMDVQSAEAFVESLDLNHLDFDFKKDPCTLVEGKSLRLIGRGVRNKKTRDALAIACENEECRYLRFVYSKQGNPYACFIGDKMPAAKSSDPKLLKKAHRLIVQEYLDYHPTYESFAKVRTQEILSFFTMVAGTSVIALSGPVSGPGSAATFLKGGSFMIGVYFLSTHQKFINWTVGDATVNVNASDKGHWNWSEDARDMRPNAFRMLVRQITHGKPLIDGHYVGKNTFDLNNRYTHKRSRLEKKGVEFSEISNYDWE